MFHWAVSFGEGGGEGGGGERGGGKEAGTVVRGEKSRRWKEAKKMAVGGGRRQHI